MRFVKQVKSDYPRKVKKKFVKKYGRLHYFTVTSRAIRRMLERQDLRALPTMLTIDTNSDAEKVFTWTFKP